MCIIVSVLLAFGWQAGRVWQSCSIRLFKKMHHICDLFENHIERPTKKMKQLTNSNEKQYFVLFRFYLACICVYDEFFGTYIYCAIRMGPLSLIHEQSHWLEIRNYVYIFFICWNFVAFYQVMHDTVCYYYYSIFIVMLLLYGITLLYDNGTFQHDLVETDRNLNVTRKKRTLYNIAN